MRNRFLQIAALLLICGSAAAASRVENLYQGRAIVTGQGAESRAGGLASALAQVLVKVSGDPRVPDHPAAAGLAARASDLVASFRYRDRMAGIPVHDEQGTRDRPYDLIVDFDPARVDAALGYLGATPWDLNRPQVLVLAGVRTGTAEYVLTSDGERGLDQRQALIAEAERYGVPITLPSTQALIKVKLDLADLAAAASSETVATAKRIGGDAVLQGQLVWNPDALGWVSDWRLSMDGAVSSWRKEGGSFDQAFRTAMTGVAQILSGNGKPD